MAWKGQIPITLRTFASLKKLPIDISPAWLKFIFSNFSAVGAVQGLNFSAGTRIRLIFRLDPGPIPAKDLKSKFHTNG